MRLIDAEDIVNTLGNMIEVIGYDGKNLLLRGQRIGLNSAMGQIRSAPTIEAEPIIHARWVKMSDADGLYYCCGNCGEDLPRYYIERPTYDNPFPNMESIDKTPRCPYCGAIMSENDE